MLYNGTECESFAEFRNIRIQERKAGIRRSREEVPTMAKVLHIEERSAPEAYDYCCYLARGGLESPEEMRDIMNRMKRQRGDREHDK